MGKLYIVFRGHIEQAEVTRKHSKNSAKNQSIVPLLRSIPGRCLRDIPGPAQLSRTAKTTCRGQEVPGMNAHGGADQAWIVVSERLLHSLTCINAAISPAPTLRGASRVGDDRRAIYAGVQGLGMAE